MKALVCKNCGAIGLQFKDGHVICEYCDTKFLLTSGDFMSDSNSKLSSVPKVSNAIPSGISLGNDIEMLLQKCKMYPQNARKYANLVLDIDPDNKEARKYL